jgi:hypothetical protein
MLDKDKHSSISDTFVSYSPKMFYNFDMLYTSVDTSVIYEFSYKARVFVPGRPFQPKMFVYKATLL